MKRRRWMTCSGVGVLLWLVLGSVRLVMAQEPVQWERLLLDYGKITAEDLAVSSHASAPDWKLGARRAFYVIQSDDAETLTADAELIWLGENFAVWLDSDVRLPVRDPIRAGFADFDQRVIGFMRSRFGTEASPGVDNDPRLHALFTDKLGAGVLGYFSSRDTLSPALSPFSNGMELFILSGELLRTSGERVVNTLSHEFQHMIHFHQDVNEGSNFDEGFSGLAEELTGKRFSDGTETAFYRHPDTPLSWWRVSPSLLANYGASYLFTRYVAERMGQAFLRPWGMAAANHFDGLDEALRTSGANVSADDLYATWLGENLRTALRASRQSADDGRDGGSSQAVAVTELACAAEPFIGEVQSYGGRYFHLKRDHGSARITITFEPEIPIFAAVGAEETAPFYASGTESNSLSSLFRTFDLTAARAPVTLSFRMAADLEEDFDFLYLLSSLDAGNSWDLVPFPGGSAKNLSGFNLGHGLTGATGGWREVSIDLTPWIGNRVALRFDVITDQAVTGEGVFLRAFRLSDGSRASAGADEGWEAAGWTRFESNRTPIAFTIVTFDSGAEEKDAAIQVVFPESDAPFMKSCDFHSESAPCAFALAGINRQSRSPGRFTIQVSCDD